MVIYFSWVPGYNLDKLAKQVAVTRCQTQNGSRGRGGYDRRPNNNFFPMRLFWGRLESGSSCKIECPTRRKIYNTAPGRDT